MTSRITKEESILSFLKYNTETEKWERSFIRKDVANCNFFSRFLVDTESEETLLEFYRQHGIIFIGDPYAATLDNNKIHFKNDSSKDNFTKDDLKKLKSFFKPRS